MNEPHPHGQISWQWLPFDALGIYPLFDILRLRQDVFVLEQCSLFRDIDGLDPVCLHGMGRDGNGQLVACARIAPPGSCFAEPCIGRVIIAAAWRKQGLGRTLMQQAITQAQRLYPAQTISISAQLHLAQFYGSLGFRLIGQPYDEAGILHSEMQLSPVGASIVAMAEQRIPAQNMPLDSVPA